MQSPLTSPRPCVKMHQPFSLLCLADPSRDAATLNVASSFKDFKGEAIELLFLLLFLKQASNGIEFYGILWKCTNGLRPQDHG